MVAMIWMVKEVIATLICSLTKYTFFSKVYFVYCTNKIDYFGVSTTIVLGGSNSGQTSIKCSGLACDAESPTLMLNFQLPKKYVLFA